MNIIEIHERVRFWLDRVATARFEPLDIDNALNIAQNDLIEAKYAGSKLNQGDSFQRTQKIRDELSNIVKMTDSNSGLSLTNVSGSTLITKASLPTDYMVLLAIAFYESATIKHNCWPLTYDRENVVQDNPYRRVRTTPFPKVYYNESNLGIKITHAFGNPNKVVIYYLANPIAWSYGFERTSSYTFSVNPTPVIASSEGVVYNGIERLLGTKFNITAPTSITSGTVVSGFTESNINDQLSENLARKAAINALITIGEREKALDLIKIYD
jgi:hypothetical protein